MISRSKVLLLLLLLFLLPSIVCLAQEVSQETQSLPQQGQVTKGSAGTISLDLKGVNILDVLKLISKESGLNIAAGQNVRGTVTIFLKDVDIWDALRIVLETNGLAYEREENLVKVMTDQDYERIFGERFHEKTKIHVLPLQYSDALSVSQSLNQVKTRVGRIVVDERANTLILIDIPERIDQMVRIVHELDVPAETRVFELNYASAEETKTKLEEIVTKGVGKIRLDKRTNKIVVTDTPKKLAEMQRIIDAFDERAREVLIDAKIVQIELDDEYSLGVQWDAIFAGIDAHSGGHFSVIGDVIGASSPSTGTAVTMGTLDSQGYKLLFEALETIGRTEVVSSPRIAAMNNQEAKVLVGTRQPFVTETTTTPATGASVTAEAVTFVDVGVNLTVTPTITNDGYVLMKIKPEVSSLGTPIKTSKGNEIPVVSTSQAETNVLVKNGNTIVLAGLIENRKTQTDKEVPLLGRLPLVGSAFRSRTIGSTSLPEKKELVIFLTPTIISGAHEAKEWKSFSATVEEGRAKASFRFRGEEEKAKRSEDKKETPRWTSPEKALFLYSRLLSERIGQKLRANYLKRAQIGEVHLAFTLLSNGELVEEPEVLNTIDETLKKAVLLSVKEASPFPPFPEGIAGTQRRFKLVVSFE
ncbi:MAG: hypothetical protein HY590_05440 [Candidatus Omnitrophica bacterium]|nr:hypothetical protein [Candidatus Omnitrophota bacterium]